MVVKSRLRQAIIAEKGIDMKKKKQRRDDKLNSKQAAGAERSDDDVSDEELKFDLDAVNDSDTSDSSVDMEERLPRRSTANAKAQATKQVTNEDDDEEEDEEEDDIPVSDLEDLDEEDREDLVPHTRLTINNTSALLTSLERISIPTDSSVPFASHQCVISQAQTSDSIPDVSDDLQRELAFYSQCLEAAKIGRAKLIKEGVPFSRPKDYFAEMVKEDAHMEKVKAKLVEEASNKKAAAEARKLRDLKKFGKQVQVAKLQERQKAKKETLEKIKTLKRKRQESNGDTGGATEADLFDIGIDNEIGKPSRGKTGAGVNAKRVKKNEKYGFGGKKRHGKSGDAMSSGDLSGFNAKKMKTKGKATRPGKGRRKAMSSK
ncbi:hypothetical protein VHEMI10066 [[Torrubiella] hemipterigena]|uniref:Uncharacterized protein n=1 Tax=[Torrubiella] hemipterigena TaxID=1531966 RepID=A0A0A1TRG8_9HYPO|nr:hypothetical protein VHEMI10066 [[Torrubiella] hemipterigena]